MVGLALIAWAFEDSGCVAWILGHRAWWLVDIAGPIAAADAALLATTGLLLAPTATGLRGRPLGRRARIGLAVAGSVLMGTILGSGLERWVRDFRVVDESAGVALDGWRLPLGLAAALAGCGLAVARRPVTPPGPSRLDTEAPAVPAGSADG